MRVTMWLKFMRMITLRMLKRIIMQGMFELMSMIPKTVVIMQKVEDEVV